MSIKPLATRILCAVGPVALLLNLGCPAGSSLYYYAGPAPISANLVISNYSINAGDIGSASVDITGATGDLTYQWSISSPGLIVGSANDLTVSFGSPSAGSLSLAVTVTDSGSGTTATSATQIQFQTPPEPAAALVVNAGADQTVAVGNTVLLQGSAAGAIPGYGFQWRQASGPFQVTKPEFADGSSSITIVGTTPGVAVFELSVGDSTGTLASNTVQVVVTAAPNQD